MSRSCLVSPPVFPSLPPSSSSLLFSSPIPFSSHFIFFLLSHFLNPSPLNFSSTSSSLLSILSLPTLPLLPPSSPLHISWSQCGSFWCQFCGLYSCLREGKGRVWLARASPRPSPSRRKDTLELCDYHPPKGGGEHGGCSPCFRKTSLIRGQVRVFWRSSAFYFY